MIQRRKKAMLNAEKIRLMTDLAIYEKKHGESVFKVNSFYKSDYIMSSLIAAFIRYTLCYLLLFIMYLLFRPDGFFTSINLDGITNVLTDVGLIYAAGLLLYLTVTFFVYSARYKRAKRGILLYATKLKRLGRKYCIPKQQRTAGRKETPEYSAAQSAGAGRGRKGR